VFENNYDINISILYKCLGISYLQFVGGENPEKKEIIISNKWNVHANVPCNKILEKDCNNTLFYLKFKEPFKIVRMKGSYGYWLLRMAGKNINSTAGKITANFRSYLLKKRRIIRIIIVLNGDNRYLNKIKRKYRALTCRKHAERLERRALLFHPIPLPSFLSVLPHNFLSTV
jgi:hypothetical protein